jgi:aminoglycoside phosphotransferase (APT) family kinase protein
VNFKGPFRRRNGVLAGMNGTDAVEGVDLERLTDWMDDHDLAAGPILDIDLLTGGTQNILMRFSRGGQEYVLRRPPVHKRDNSDETMRREARVLAALSSSSVPHPALIASCGDIDVLGAAFYLMEPINGLNPTVELPAALRQEPTKRFEFGLAVADGASSIAAVDYVSVGLSDLGNPQGFLERQVERWRNQLDSYSTLDGYAAREIPHVQRVADWLDTNRPASSCPGLVHGDYHLANVMCAPDRPALAAIIDWELTTIGDPLLDLGWLLATWPDENGQTITATDPPRPWQGFPRRHDLVQRYAERSSRDLSCVVWYEVLACYKLGIILEGTHARANAGLAPREIGDRLHASALRLFQRAVRRITS